MKLLRDLGKSFLSGQPHSCVNKDSPGARLAFLIFNRFPEPQIFILFEWEPDSSLVFFCSFVCLFEFSVVLSCFILVWTIDGQFMMLWGTGVGGSAPH